MGCLVNSRLTNNTTLYTKRYGKYIVFEILLPGSKLRWNLWRCLNRLPSGLARRKTELKKSCKSRASLAHPQA